jgi:hypothetical protein
MSKNDDEAKNATRDERRGSRASRREFRFERIEAWQLVRQFNRQVYSISRKFPEGYILELNKSEKLELVENFHRLWFTSRFLR